MKIESLTLRNFRNIEQCTLRPEPGLNFLVGQNGQGKTSVLEALGYLATLRSFRGAKTVEVIRHGTPAGELNCLISEENWSTELRVSFEENTKTAHINGKPYRSSTQYLSQRFGSYELGFHTVVFNPSDHDLVRGDPAGRRAFLDRVLAAEDLEYLKALSKYQRLLVQRNALLKAPERPARDVLAGFTEPLVSLGAVLVKRRLEWLGNVASKLDFVARQIAPSQPPVRLFYGSKWMPGIEGLSLDYDKLSMTNHPGHFAGLGALPSLELLEQAFWKRLSDLEAAEWRSGHTLVGPHRDDWGFFLGDEPLRSCGSQGEIRSVLLALKLSEVESFRGATGHRPFFLLDDFSSELDRERRSFLLRFLMETDLQVFVTTTEDTVFAGRRFWVWNGTIHEQSAKPDEAAPGHAAAGHAAV